MTKFKQIYFHLAVLKALKVESGFIELIGIILLLSILPLLTLVIWSCSKPSYEVTTRSLIDDSGTPIADTLIAIDERDDTNLFCRRFLQILLNVLAILIL